MPIAPTEMYRLDGKIACAKIGGDPFLNVTRPDAVSGLCPGNKTPCSTQTSKQNSVCYEPSEIATNCPIIAIKAFKTNSAEATQYKKSSDWTLTNKIGDYTLAYTKTAADSLPVTRT
jgi:hypothetical protein